MNFYGLLGEKLKHSFSPEIHSLVFKDLKTQDAYKLFEVEKDNLDGFVESVKLLGVKGFNITIPYKEDIIKYLDDIAIEAKEIGAVNTVIIQDGKLKGFNTDYYGFGMLLEKNQIDVGGTTCTLLGYGGACKSSLQYLLDNGAKKIYIATRNPEKYNELNTEKVEFISYKNLYKIKGDIIINTTPIGMYPNTGVSPVDEDIISNYIAVVDLIYNPEITEFLRIGINQNKKSVNGLLMLVGQAIAAEEIWNSTKINDECIDEIYKIMKKKF